MVRGLWKTHSLVRDRNSINLASSCSSLTSIRRSKFETGQLGGKVRSRCTRSAWCTINTQTTTGTWMGRNPRCGRIRITMGKTDVLELWFPHRYATWMIVIEHWTRPSGRIWVSHNGAIFGPHNSAVTAQTRKRNSTKWAGPKPGCLQWPSHSKQDLRRSVVASSDAIG